MSLETANAKAERSRIVDSQTELLEVLAFAIHPGTTENTSTICLMNNEVYLTSQDNLKFDEVSVGTLQDKLVKLKKIAASGADLNTKLDQWWNEACALSSQVGKQVTATGLPRSADTVVKSDAKIATLKSGLYARLMQQLFSRDQRQLCADIQALHDEIFRCRVVLNEHIFRKAPSTTGFHGESRILRYFFICWASGYIPQALVGATEGRALLDQSRGEPYGEARMALIQRLEKKFVAVSREWGMRFGSSQGTCSGCSRALDIVGAARGATGAAFKQWLDPLDLSGSQTGTSIQANIREHALNLVLSDFDLHDEPMEVS